jgi:3-isopropylmalate/(R)-2-methylmalate dehydratase large subunit
MTVCNMAIEAGARAGLIGVDETTLAYVQGRPYSPKGVELQQAIEYWRTLRSDADAHWDAVVELDASTIRPQVTWGTSPEMVLSIEDRVPDPDREKDPNRRGAMERALQYMALEPNKPIADILIDKVFIGSCTNSRIEDMREAAAVVRRLGGRIAKNVKLAMVVPGSGLVKEQAEREGLDQVFKAGRLRVARARLLDVPRDERRPARAGRALRVRPRTATSKDARARAAARTWSARRWPRRPRSKGHFVDVRRIA